MQITSLKSKFITRIMGCIEKESPSNTKLKDYAVEVLKIKFNLKLVKRQSLQMFFKISVIKNIANFAGKQKCWIHC